MPRRRPRSYGYAVEFRQSNHEGELVDWIQEAGVKKAAGIVINPAGYTHTSIAILDAICGVEAADHRSAHHQYPRARDFRIIPISRKGAQGVICGFGVAGYALAIDGLAALVDVRRKGRRDRGARDQDKPATPTAVPAED